MVFQCSHPGCEAKFRRREHLNRHSNCHSPKASFACPYCESILTRNDLLRRHIRARHSQNDLPESRSMTACIACHSRKERCRGGIPCDACRNRGNLCKSPKEQLSPRTLDEGEDRINSQAQTMWQPPIVTTPAISHISELKVAVPHTARWAAQDYVDHYFTQFHPEWPFLHRSTFDSAKEPCILVQSVLMVGLWIDGSREARNAAEFLHARLYSAIQDQKEQWCTSCSRSDRTTNISWLMPIYQSVLLNIILALLKSRESSRMDFSLRYMLSAHTYELLVTLVQTCRDLGMFHYPSMLRRYNDTPPPLAWIYVEEIKRFGLALYRVCQLLNFPDMLEGRTAVIGRELLDLTDLEFCMPGDDEMWNASTERRLETFRHSTSRDDVKDESDSGNWISETLKVSSDAIAGFDQILLRLDARSG